MRSLMIAFSFAVASFGAFGVAPAAAQLGTTNSAAGLPEDFRGKVQYFGNHSGEVRTTVPGTPRRGDTKCPKREGGCPELIGGSFQAELEFDGDIVRGKYRGTGGMRPSTLIGRRNGANCRLFDTTDGSVWSGRCDSEAFIGTVLSVPNAPEQIELAFETVGVSTIDFYERDRKLELIRAYERYAGTVFGEGAGESRLDAILRLHGYFVEPGHAYRGGTLRNVDRESEKKNSPIYAVTGEYTRQDGASAWVRARFEYDRFVCIETSVEPGYCRVIDPAPPQVDPIDDDLFASLGVVFAPQGS